MGFARRELSETASANKPEYETSFVVRSHSLLSMGYVRLDAPSFAQHEEEDITGELTRAYAGRPTRLLRPTVGKAFLGI